MLEAPGSPNTPSVTDAPTEPALTDGLDASSRTPPTRRGTTCVDPSTVTSHRDRAPVRQSLHPEAVLRLAGETKKNGWKQHSAPGDRAEEFELGAVPHEPGRVRLIGEENGVRPAPAPGQIRSRRPNVHGCPGIAARPTPQAADQAHAWAGSPRRHRSGFGWSPRRAADGCPPPGRRSRARCATAHWGRRPAAGTACAVGSRARRSGGARGRVLCRGCCATRCDRRSRWSFGVNAHQ